MRKYNTIVIDSFYCHMNNGGLHVDLEEENDDDEEDNDNVGIQSLCAQWIHFGNQGPHVKIPLLTVKQVDGMIALLEKAKERISENHSYNLGEPQFDSAKKLEDILK